MIETDSLNFSVAILAEREASGTPTDFLSAEARQALKKEEERNKRLGSEFLFFRIEWKLIGSQTAGMSERDRKPAAAGRMYEGE